MEVKCAYCNWVGQEPSPAEYASDKAYDEAMARYIASHDDEACYQGREY